MSDAAHLDPQIFAPARPGLFGATAVGRDTKVAYLGMPFDCGRDPHRIGARLGPQAARGASQRLDTLDPETDRDYAAGLADAGDALCVPGDVEASYPTMQAAVARLLELGIKPLTMGGDGAVTLPQLRAVAAKHPGLAVLHVDSHTDAYPRDGYDNATTFLRAAEEGLVDTGASWHVGLRGTVSLPGVYRTARQLGYRLVTMDALAARGIPDMLAELRAALDGRPVYLCYDLDSFDPSIAPGVVDPMPGGLSAREGLSLLRGLEGLNVVAADINTLSPPHDPAGTTALLAAQVCLEALRLLAPDN
jgi:agmatinase